MEIFELAISGAWVAQSQVFEDDRGSFREWFKHNEIKSITGLDFSVAQANLSQSKRGVVRGIHYSIAPEGQAKWITCVTGAIKDVIVDIRPNSPTYKKYVEVNLVGGSGKAVLISAGLGHAFLSLEEEAYVAYLVSSGFSPEHEFEINPLDPEIGIQWGLPVAELLLSVKDSNAPTLNQRRGEGRLP